MLPRRAIVAAAVTLATAVPVASASADTTLNIVPHGNVGPGVPWATAPGILPADTQAKMYDRITPLFRNITPDVLTPSTDGTGYYKSAALLAETDPSFVLSETVSGTSPSAGAVSARIKRDVYGIPHIYSDTDAGAIFGAGYAVATDQSLLLNQARNNGFAGLIDMPGVPAINLVLGLFDYKPSEQVVDEATKLQNQVDRGEGRAGQATAQRHRHLRGGHQRAAAGEWVDGPQGHPLGHLFAERHQGPVPGRGRRRGGRQRAVPRRAAPQLGAKEGDKAFEDLRGLEAGGRGLRVAEEDEPAAVRAQGRTAGRVAARMGRSETPARVMAPLSRSQT